MAASAKSHRACGPSFVFLARPRSCDALKSPRNATGIVMTNLHRSPPLNQSKIDLGIVNESQLLRFGIRQRFHNYKVFVKGQNFTVTQPTDSAFLKYFYDR